MTVYYLDSSAWVKRYTKEAGTAWLKALLAQGHPVACSTLGVIEVTSTLARQRKAGQPAADLFDRKIDDLENDWATMVRMDITRDVVERARGVARTHFTRGADSVHLASAQLLSDGLSSQGNQMVLVAADHQLLDAARASGMSTLDPAEEEAKSAP